MIDRGTIKILQSKDMQVFIYPCFARLDTNGSQLATA